MEKETTSMDYKLPSLELLDECIFESKVSYDEIAGKMKYIRNVLEGEKVRVRDIEPMPGPAVTLYKVFLETGVKASKVRLLLKDAALGLYPKGMRDVTLEGCIGIEIANDHRAVVPVCSVLSDEAFRNSKAELPVAIGRTFGNAVKVFDLAKAPNLLIAGATKQGKTQAIHAIVASLLYSRRPSELKFVFIDPKDCEFSAYKRILKHYRAALPPAGSEEEQANNAIIKKAKDAADVLNSLCVEMDDRYGLLSLAGVKKIKEYNEKYRKCKLLSTEGHRYLPYIVVVIDEFADLTMPSGLGYESKALASGISKTIIRLAQLGRAAGIHLIIATQRPSVSIITRDIKVNFPMRIAFRTSSRMDSQTILDFPGAECLIGSGDMLLKVGVERDRIQCALVDTKEIDRITKFIESQNGTSRTIISSSGTEV